MTIKEAHERLEASEKSETLRLQKGSFTRTSPIGAKRIVGIILRRISESLQLCVEKFFDEIGEASVSKQALSQARKKLNPEYVREYADMTSQIAAQDTDVPTYKGMRLIAIDGSTVALENTPELKEAFGTSGSKSNAATAICSIAYGPLDHAIYDCRIDHIDADERVLAKAHVMRLTELGLTGSLLLHDRGYPSAGYIAFLYESGYNFVMRVKRKFNVKIDEIKTQGWVELTHNNKSYPVRVLKLQLISGETETLVTSLNKKQLPISEASQLYFKRWKAETAYDLIKSKLELENFSGKTKISVLQDFYATMYLANLVSFAAEAADEAIAQADSQKNLKYARKSNQNRIISRLRTQFFIIITEPCDTMRNAMLERLIDYIIRYPVSVVPGRSSPRKPPRKKRFFQNRPSVL